MSHIVSAKVFRSYAGVYTHVPVFSLLDLQDGDGINASVSVGLFNYIGSAWARVTTYTPGTTKAFSILTKLNGDYALIDNNSVDTSLAFFRNGGGIKLFVGKDKTFSYYPVTGATVTYAGVDYPLGDLDDCAALVAAWNATELANLIGLADCVNSLARVFPRIDLPVKTIPKVNVTL